MKKNAVRLLLVAVICSISLIPLSGYAQNTGNNEAVEWKKYDLPGSKIYSKYYTNGNCFVYIQRGNEIIEAETSYENVDGKIISTKRIIFIDGSSVDQCSGKETGYLENCTSAFEIQCSYAAQHLPKEVKKLFYGNYGIE